jgi:tetratricopeptide (TPR) repeat protein
MALNKAKVLKSAEKYVIQGKISHAISEYQKLIKEDPTDLPLVNTLGDLYVRIGNVPEAIKCFTRLAESYDNGGFVVRAIAMYKKVSKIDPGQVQALYRLADLYLRQGLISDARTHYLQVAETLLKKNENENAASIFQKIIAVDSENPLLETRLAEVYLKLGKKSEAVQAFHAAAQKYRKKGSLDEAENFLRKAFELDESNVEVMLSYAGVLSDSGKTDEALSQLNRIQFNDFKPEVHEAIFQINLKAGRLPEAENTAVHLLELDNTYFQRNLALAEAYVQANDLDKAFSQIEKVAQIATEKGEGQAIEDQLKSILQRDPEHIPSLLELTKFYIASSARHNVPSLLEKLGNLYVRRGQLDEAVNAFKELIKLEPNEPSHRESLNQLRQRLGLAEEDIELPQLVPDMAALADKFVSEPTLTTIATDAGTEQREGEPAFEDGGNEQVKGFIVEGDLFASYGLYQKAIDQYSKVLDVIPNHIEIHEKIRDTYAKGGELQKAAQECLILANIYTARSDNENAAKNFNLAYQYDPELHQAPVRKDQPAEPAPSVHPVAPQPSVRREVPPSERGRLQELLEEIDFYFDQGFLDEAKSCIDSYLKVASPDPELIKRLERYDALSKGQPERSGGPEVISAATESDLNVAEPAVDARIEGFETTSIPLPASDANATHQMTVSGFETTSLTANSESKKIPAATARSSESFDEIMIDLDHELASSSLEKAAGPMPTAESPAPPRKVKSAPVIVPGSGLEDVFAEFKAGFEEDDSEVPDYETHYNLGIAFKEMGLVEEAIAEFQKALKAQFADDAGEEFVRCCNMLGLCFVEKGLPQVAVKWFTKGLATPGRDEETYQALRYDLGCAHEKAGNVKAALETFLDVYGVNINYRDVTEKIENLKKSV